MLVGADLVGALAASPLGGLDLAAALQPTLDAAAAALGVRVRAPPARSSSAWCSPTSAAPSPLVPLAGSRPAATLLLPDAVLRAAALAIATHEQPATPSGPGRRMLAAEPAEPTPSAPVARCPGGPAPTARRPSRPRPTAASTSRAASRCCTASTWR